MKNIFLRVIGLCFITHFVTSSEVTWTGLGGENSMTGQSADDLVGWSLAMDSSGTIIVVSELGWSNGAGDGRVRTYRLENGIWTEFGGATSMTGENSGDSVGYSVDTNSDGSIVVVGEPGWNGVGNNSGRVRTYSLQGGVWTEFGGATSITGQVTNDQAGYSVAISSDGSLIAVGEPDWDGVGGSLSTSGRVRTYILQGGVWTQTGGATSMTGETNGSRAGYSVAMNSEGTIVAVGEFGWSGSRGRVRTYSLQGGVWTEFGGATSMTGQAGDNAGHSVAMNSDGTIVAVGEPGWDGVGGSLNGSGRVRTYSLQGGVWTQTGGATSMTGQNSGDNAGWSVAMSSDGTTIAVGEYNWSGTRGRVRTYSLQDGVWTELGGSTSMAGQSTDDEAGYSVAINSDGTIVAVGEDGWNNGSYNGRVRVYQYSSSSESSFENEDRIRNSDLAHVCYSDISQGTYTDHQTTPGGVGQGAWFTPYRITVQGR